MSEIKEVDHRSQRERMMAGDLYVVDADLETDIVAANLALARYNTLAQTDPEAARELLENLLGSIGPETVIRPPFRFDYGRNIHIGARCYLNYAVTALDVALITICDDVLIGPNVQLLTPTHPLDPELRRAKFEAAAPITICENVWIGGGATVLAGVTIGANSIVGAAAVVTRDVPANVVVAGNPARVIRTL